MSRRHFVQESDIQYFKPLIFGSYLDSVQLRGIRNQHGVVGFSGLAMNDLEMLFVIPSISGKGIRQKLLGHPINAARGRKVEVNQAEEFYHNLDLKFNVGQKRMQLEAIFHTALLA